VAISRSPLCCGLWPGHGGCRLTDESPGRPHLRRWQDVRQASARPGLPAAGRNPPRPPPSPPVPSVVVVLLLKASVWPPQALYQKAPSVRLRPAPVSCAGTVLQAGMVRALVCPHCGLANNSQVRGSTKASPCSGHMRTVAQRQAGVDQQWQSCTPRPTPMALSQPHVTRPIPVLCHLHQVQHTGPAPVVPLYLHLPPPLVHSQPVGAGLVFIRGGPSQGIIVFQHGREYHGIIPVAPVGVLSLQVWQPPSPGQVVCVVLPPAALVTGGCPPLSAHPPCLWWPVSGARRMPLHWQSPAPGNCSGSPVCIWLQGRHSYGAVAGHPPSPCNRPGLLPPSGIGSLMASCICILYGGSTGSSPVVVGLSVPQETHEPPVFQHHGVCSAILYDDACLRGLQVLCGTVVVGSSTRPVCPRPCYPRRLHRMCYSAQNARPAATAFQNTQAHCHSSNPPS